MQLVSVSNTMMKLVANSLRRCASGLVAMNVFRGSIKSKYSDIALRKSLGGYKTALEPKRCVFFLELMI